jgi:hypothetical protein
VYESKDYASITNNSVQTTTDVFASNPLYDTAEIQFGILVRSIDYTKLKVVTNPSFASLNFNDTANTVMPMTNDSVSLLLMGESIATTLANASTNTFEIKFNDYDIDKALNMTMGTFQQVQESQSG